MATNSLNQVLEDLVKSVQPRIRSTANGFRYCVSCGKDWSHNAPKEEHKDNCALVAARKALESLKDGEEKQMYQTKHEMDELLHKNPEQFLKDLESFSQETLKKEDHWILAQSLEMLGEVKHSFHSKAKEFLLRFLSQEDTNKYPPVVLEGALIGLTSICIDLYTDADLRTFKRFLDHPSKGVKATAEESIDFLECYSNPETFPEEE